MTGVTFTIALGLKYFTGNCAVMSAATTPLFSTSTSGAHVSDTSSLFFAIFLKQLQLENVKATTTSNKLNFISFFIN